MEYKTDLRVEPYRKDNGWWFKVGIRDGFVFDVFEGEALGWMFSGVCMDIYRPESAKAKPNLGLPQGKKVKRKLGTPEENSPHRNFSFTHRNFSFTL